MRLVANGRIPINIWGDVLLDGSEPQIRRVVTGQDAHESLLSFFYLAEILSLQELVSAIPVAEAAIKELPEVTERWAHLKRHSSDPQHHANDEVLQVFVPVVTFLSLIGPGRSEFAELGCSFFASIDKIKICEALLGLPAPISNLKYSAIDHSEFFLRGATSFHAGDQVTRYLDYSDWSPSSEHPLHLSRFVASYAVNSTSEFAKWMEKFSAFHVIDVVTLGSADWVTSNNGLRQTFFHLPSLVQALHDAGWAVYANHISPDFNNGSRCAVVKLFGIRRDLAESLKFQEAVTAHRDLASLLPMERLEPEAVVGRLRAIEASMTDAEWSALAAYKRHFPVWGAPVEPVKSLDDVGRLTRPPSMQINLKLPEGQVNYYVRHALRDM